MSIFNACVNKDEHGSTDTNNTKGSKDYTDSTRKPLVVDTTAIDTLKHIH